MNKINKGILIISLLAGSIGANAQNLRTNDSKGIGMAIAAMIIIFVSLIFFYFVFCTEVGCGACPMRRPGRFSRVRT